MAARYGHAAVSLPDGRVLLLGGFTSSGNSNDVWVSVDKGFVWSLVTVSAGWGGKPAHYILQH